MSIQNLVNTRVRPPNNRVNHTSFMRSSGRHPHHHHRVGRLRCNPNETLIAATHFLNICRSLGADAGTCGIACADSAEPEMRLSSAHSRKQELPSGNTQGNKAEAYSSTSTTKLELQSQRYDQCTKTLPYFRAAVLYYFIFLHLVFVGWWPLDH